MNSELDINRELICQILETLSDEEKIVIDDYQLREIYIWDKFYLNKI